MNRRKSYSNHKLLHIHQLLHVLYEVVLWLSSSFVSCR